MHVDHDRANARRHLAETGVARANRRVRARVLRLEHVGDRSECRDEDFGATDLCEAHQASETGDDFRDHSRVEFSLLDPGHEEPEGEIVDPFE